MFVRIETVKDTDVILVVNEDSRYLGKMMYSDFIDCLVGDKNDYFEEDDYLYFCVNKEIINKFLTK